MLTALIPARGGSKGIPRKNIRAINGHPLIAWTVAAALESGVFGGGVVVSTDDDEICSVAERYGARVHMRAPATATDTASTESVMLDFVQASSSADNDADVLCLIQATSPTTSAEQLRDAVGAFRAALADGSADSLVTVARAHRFRWAPSSTGASTVCAQNYEPRARPRRQDWPGELYETGSFYMCTRGVLRATQCRLGARVLAFELPSYASYEIDDELDWLVVEHLLKHYATSSPSPLSLSPAASLVATAKSAVCLAVFDADGVLTDGTQLFDATGVAMKAYHTRDAAGLRLLRERGAVEVGIITGERTPPLVRAAEKWGVRRVEIGCTDKLPVLDAWRRELRLEWSQVAYMGDDYFDVPCLRAVAWSAAPRDAHESARRVARFVADADGGHGAVRAFCDFLLAKMNV